MLSFIKVCVDKQNLHILVFREYPQLNLMWNEGKTWVEESDPKILCHLRLECEDRSEKHLL